MICLLEFQCSCRTLQNRKCPFLFFLLFLTFTHQIHINTESTAAARLTWSLPPHSPLPGFSGGLTSKIRHDHCRLADQLTWSPLPVSGMALQPQTQAAALPSVYFVFSVCSRSKGHTIHCLCPCGFNYF